MANITIAIHSSKDPDRAHALSDLLSLPITETLTEHDYVLQYTDAGLCLVALQHPFKPLLVDFLHGANAHRSQYGGGKSQLIAKACGVRSKQRPTILDLTGGLCRDAFVLACLGCHVTVIERHPIIHALVNDGLARLKKAPKPGIALHLIQHNAIDYLKTTNPTPEVIYLDPMYPERTKSALVKKELRILRDLVGADLDSDALLPAALSYATQRVVVKRPVSAPPLNHRTPSQVYRGKSGRFDVYHCQAATH